MVSVRILSVEVHVDKYGEEVARTVFRADVLATSGLRHSDSTPTGYRISKGHSLSVDMLSSIEIRPLLAGFLAASISHVQWMINRGCCGIAVLGSDKAKPPPSGAHAALDCVRVDVRQLLRRAFLPLSTAELVQGGVR